MNGNTTARDRDAIVAEGRPGTEGNITRIQRFSTHDGPGVRTTVFFKGCPLRCRWCHNPETISTQPELLFFAERCRHCGSCVAACPEGAHRLVADRHELDRSRCRLHYACVAACPFGALEASLERTTVGRVMETVLRDAAYYRNSGGGLTLSGGEPLMQPEFAGDLLAAARAAGVHTAVDSCLHAPWGIIEALTEAVDLWLVDLKIMDPGRHELYTGVPNALILENLRRLAALPGIGLWVRMPLMEGVNTGQEDLEAAGAFLEEIGTLSLVELLPYHALGVDKREALGESAPERFSPPSSAQMERLARELRGRGLQVRYAGERQDERQRGPQPDARSRQGETR
ncbi:MAG: glycyl-radical enzyme activating protein [Spirochaetales bacterium]|nr:glycyl-radical enzyme activating protein [Spirochaetales bacterium]